MASLLQNDLAENCRRTVESEQEQQLHENGLAGSLAQAQYQQRATRIRFHLGSLLWGMSFRIWPISPVFDPAWSELTLAITPSVYSGRESQDWVLASRYADLARLPICHDTTFPRPLLKPAFGIGWYDRTAEYGGKSRALRAFL